MWSSRPSVSALVWRRGTGRREEFLLLAKELAARAKKTRHEPVSRRVKS